MSSITLCDFSSPLAAVHNGRINESGLCHTECLNVLLFGATSIFVSAPCRRGALVGKMQKNTTGRQNVAVTQSMPRARKQ
ncbi:unnamed protein product [Ixodes pacificus]